nr:hypothetical protein GCM10025699_19610 [Microbacterium flavescens]
MRILIITPWFPTAEAPQQGLFVYREAVALARSHDVRVLHLDWTGPAEAGSPAGGGFPLARVRLRRSRPLDYLRARRAVRRAAADADVVHTHALTLLIPWAAGRVTRRPWVHSEHWSGLTSPETLSAAERVVAAVLRPALARPDVVVTESSRLTTAVARARSGPIELVPCVVPEVAVRELPSAPPLRLIGIGGLIPRKGPLLAVSALGELRARGTDAELVWVGDGPERAPMIAAAEALSIAGACVSRASSTRSPSGASSTPPTSCCCRRRATTSASSRRRPSCTGGPSCRARRRAPSTTPCRR